VLRNANLRFLKAQRMNEIVAGERVADNREALRQIFVANK